MKSYLAQRTEIKILREQIVAMQAMIERQERIIVEGINSRNKLWTMLGYGKQNNTNGV